MWNDFFSCQSAGAALQLLSSETCFQRQVCRAPSKPLWQETEFYANMPTEIIIYNIRWIGNCRAWSNYRWNWKLNPSAVHCFLWLLTGVESNPVSDLKERRFCKAQQDSCFTCQREQKMHKHFLQGKFRHVPWLQFVISY